MNLPATIRTAIDRHGLIPAGTDLFVGLSGGADSVALAQALRQLGIPFTAAHLNHNLRGVESDADERFVRELGFPLVVKSVDVRRLASEQNLSLEMAARKARHDFFAEFGEATIALAHHADDQVETFFLKLARGAGTEGLGGMAFCQQVGPLRLIRPMLGIRKESILEWLRENGCAWREDASNGDSSFLRNRVRHAILPLLERELNPEIRAAILRTMEILREENGWMAGLQDQSDSLAARRRRLRQWLFENAAEAAGFDAVEKILALVADGRGTRTFELNDRQRVVVEYGIPRFEERTIPPAPPRFVLTTEPGTGWRKDHGQGAGILPAEASFDAAKVGDSPLEVRGAEPGDRIAPLGMEGSRKLQDILTDQKLPQARRANIPVVTCRGEVVWVPGYRTARGWEVQGPGAKAIHARVERLQGG